MSELKKAPRPTPKKKPVVRPVKTGKRVVRSTSKKPKPARKRKRTVKGAEPEVRRAIPLDYVTTDDVNLRAMPDMAAAKMNGGLLGKGTG